jgi:hypothetical protein
MPSGFELVVSGATKRSPAMRGLGENLSEKVPA